MSTAQMISLGVMVGSLAIAAFGSPPETMPLAVACVVGFFGLLGGFDS